jgi:hypothetical protein
MAVGLSVARVVEVDVSFAPVAPPLANFDTLLIMGDSDVIDTGEVLRSYNDLLAVANDFGTTAPEYLAAALFFGQIPTPSFLFIGRWARTATKGELVGGPLSPSQLQLSSFTAITNGGFHVSIDGSASTNVTGINLSAALNLNGVASAVQTAVRAIATGGFTLATVVFDGSKFLIKSGTTGATSTVSFLTAPTAGTDLSPLMNLSAATATRTVAGIAAETPLQGVVRVDGRGWYGLMFAASVMPVDADRIAIAAYIQGTADKHVYGITSNAATILDGTNTTDLASQLSLADYTRTFVQYSTTSLYAVASWFGRAFSTNFEGSNTTITMKFKQEPGVIPEILSASQADALIAKRCNVYAQYNNGTFIVQEGVMSGLAYFDEIHGLDWLANRVQTSIYTKLLQSPKIPQTNPGVHILVATAEGDMSQAVNNGLLAPGTWNAPGFGSLAQGQYLPKGWHLEAGSVDLQNQSDREARKSPLIQAAVKLAGAIHSADVLINVNRALLALVGTGGIIAAMLGGVIA